MEELYRDSRRAVVESRAYLDTLERETNHSHPHFQALRGNLEALRVTQQQLSSKFNMEPTQKREIWRQKLIQLEEELSDLYRRQDMCLSRARAAQSEARMREELLSRRSQAGKGDAAIQIDSYETEAKSLKSSTNMTDQLMETGVNVVEMLQSQRAKLKGAKKRALDVANQLGVSKDLIRSIEKRELSDTYLAIGGTAVLVIIILIIWAVRR